MMNMNYHHHHQKKKHFLHELLSEDQEPFIINNYISEKQSQIQIKTNKKRPTNYKDTTFLQLKKQKKPTTTTIQQYHNKSTTFFPINLCKNACFNTTTATEDITKSPLFKIPQRHICSNSTSSNKSPCSSSSPNAIFLHVPARTASILLEAALRIQKHSKTRTHCSSKNHTFGLLGSFFKKLKQRGKKKKKNTEQIEGQKGNFNHNNNNEENENNVKKVRDILRFEFDSCSVFGGRKTEENAEQHYSGGGCFVDDGDNGFFRESPFRFVLQRSNSSSSSDHRTPEFSSPAASPNRHGTEDKESINNGEDSINKFDEEEEKEQCSPVSVLDPPFEDDDDVHENDYEDEDDGFDLECTYANVQRTKQQLLYRLCRFEKLAELDPLELEKRMLDQEDNECGTWIEDYNNSETTSYEENNDLKELVYEILCHYYSSIHNDKREQVSEDLKRLVYDIIIEEEIREFDSSEEDRDILIKRVCERLELWKEVDSNTIDMMVDEDFSREECLWKNNAQVKDLAGELEIAIFSLLVEEFSEDLLRC